MYGCSLFGAVVWRSMQLRQSVSKFVIAFRIFQVSNDNKGEVNLFIGVDFEFDPKSYSFTPKQKGLDVKTNIKNEIKIFFNTNEKSWE